MKRFFFALTVALLCAPCVQAADPAPKRYDLTKRASEIDPRAAEHPEINFVFIDDKGKAADLQHAVVDTRVPSQGKLVIWLMGHNQGLFERISSYGLHGIQVHYANGWFGKLTKQQHDNGDVIGKIRLEACTGEDFSPVVSIPKPDSMMERSFQFVKWLAKENPQGEWQQFLNADGTGLNWDKVIVSGISHGSTTAARFAIHQKVDRVVMFSGPRDNTESWQGLPSATPHNRFFGFTHVLDDGWVHDHYCRSWQLLGLNQFGPLVDVDKTQPPYGNSRRLITDADVKKDSRRAHSCVVPGGGSPKDAQGKFLYEPVWRYLFTHSVDQVGKPVPMDPDCQMTPIFK
ncbi:MAG: BPSS1187 family protein [Aureliella sp.]